MGTPTETLLRGIFLVRMNSFMAFKLHAVC